MFTAISCFEVQTGFEYQVKQAFINRPKMVENYNGFIRLDVISPTENPAEIWLIPIGRMNKTLKIGIKII